MFLASTSKVFVEVFSSQGFFLLLNFLSKLFLQGGCFSVSATTSSLKYQPKFRTSQEFTDVSHWRPYWRTNCNNCIRKLFPYPLHWPWSVQNVWKVCIVCFCRCISCFRFFRTQTFPLLYYCFQTFCNFDLNSLSDWNSSCMFWHKGLFVKFSNHLWTLLRWVK